MRKFKTENGTTLKRVSRWIKVRQAYNITKRHSLYGYATDENGHYEGSSNFNPKSETFLDYFIFCGKKYALNQFIGCSSQWGYPIMFYDEFENLNHISGYDSEDYYKPLLIELSESGEYVRCYYEE